jgi:hypothetical protein
MTDYQLTATDSSVIRTADNACIPNDPANRDYAAYQQWLADGGVPDPYIEPEPQPEVPSPEQQVLFDHENRLLAMEGYPPLTVADFFDKMQKPPP